MDQDYFTERISHSSIDVVINSTSYCYAEEGAVDESRSRNNTFMAEERHCRLELLKHSSQLVNLETVLPPTLYCCRSNLSQN